MPVDFARFTTVLRDLGVAGSVRELPLSAPTAAAAAAQLGCELGAIANSLVFSADGAPLLVMTSGAHRVDTVKVAALTGVSVVQRADARSVRAWTGQVIGGVAPVGHPAPIRTLVDTWLDKYDVIWAAAGHPHTVFPTSYAELIRITGGTPADVGVLGLCPEQRVPPQQVAAVPHAGKQAAGGRADLGPGHLGVLDRRAGFALAVQGAVEPVDGQAGRVGQVVADRPVRRKPDDGEAAAGPERTGHGGQGRREVHVVQRGVRAGEVEAGLGHRVSQVI